MLTPSDCTKPVSVGHPSATLPSEASVALPSATVIVPTYREAESLPELLRRVERVRAQHALDLSLLIVDDHSGDGAGELVDRFAKPWATLVDRRGERSLSHAVVDGIRLAQGDAIVIMDGDGSHPSERIPDLLRALSEGQRAALGSRYVAGGSTDVDWGFGRWLNSRIATWLARQLTRVRDPMAGFFAMWRRDVPEHLDPIGYKIVLELIVRSGLDDVAEIPIHFAKRQHGASKLGLREQLAYLRHLRRLYAHRLVPRTAMPVVRRPLNSDADVAAR